jgi:hypothetical protein
MVVLKQTESVGLLDRRGEIRQFNLLAPEFDI